ncbi:MAG: NAD(P)H-dependent oxidoreductase [Candidatus Aenigmatarchaeota archaeon]|nr:NAD(P)H-dependent oxidoreductase [Candidatus Aenigmarchaeota archaeon]
MEFERIVKERYAAKSFDKRKIPKELVDRLIEIIRMTPSSYNVQPWKIKIIEDDETKKKLMSASYNQPQVETCSHLFVLCADIDVEKNVDKIAELMIKEGVEKDKANAYSKMVKSFLKSLSKEEIIVWAQNQVYIALSNALNGAKALGFDACPMEGFDPKEYSKILKLPKNLIPTVLCPIGYANDKPRKKIRLTKDDIIF